MEAMVVTGIIASFFVRVLRKFYICSDRIQASRVSSGEKIHPSSPLEVKGFFMSKSLPIGRWGGIEPLSCRFKSNFSLYG